MTNNVFRLVPFVLAAVTASQSRGQGAFTITEGGATYTQTALGTSTGTGPVANLTLVSGGGDQLAQNFWWYGVGTNRTREFTFASGDLTSSETLSVGHARQIFTLPQFTAQIDTFLDSISATSATLRQTLTVTNTTAAPLTLDFFHYMDPTFGASSGGDAALREGPEMVQINEMLITAHYRGQASESLQAGNAPTIRDLLTNNSLNVFNGNGLPFGGADLSLGYMWRFVSIVPGGSRVCSASLGINTQAPRLPAGACRVGGGACIETLQADCIALGGHFVGDGSRCPNACPCDWNGVNLLNSQDFFDFLVDFFSGAADYNSDGVTNSQDYFDFLVCFFAGPVSCIP